MNPQSDEKNIDSREKNAAQWSEAVRGVFNPSKGLLFAPAEMLFYPSKKQQAG